MTMTPEEFEAQLAVACEAYATGRQADAEYEAAAILHEAEALRRERDEIRESHTWHIAETARLATEGRARWESEASRLRDALRALHDIVLAREAGATDLLPDLARAMARARAVMGEGTT
jgi:hypothetical protein